MTDNEKNFSATYVKDGIENKKGWFLKLFGSKELHSYTNVFQGDVIADGEIMNGELSNVKKCSTNHKETIQLKDTNIHSPNINGEILHEVKCDNHDKCYSSGSSSFYLDQKKDVEKDDIITLDENHHKYNAIITIGYPEKMSDYDNIIFTKSDVYQGIVTVNDSDKGGNIKGILHNIHGDQNSSSIEINTDIHNPKFNGFEFNKTDPSCLPDNFCFNHSEEVYRGEGIFREGSFILTKIDSGENKNVSKPKNSSDATKEDNANKIYADDLNKKLDNLDKENKPILDELREEINNRDEDHRDINYSEAYNVDHRDINEAYNKELFDNLGVKLLNANNTPPQLNNTDHASEQQLILSFDSFTTII